MSLVVVHPDGKMEPAVRKITREEHEIFASAVIRAVEIMPAWRDAIALLRPFYDMTAGTAYVDKHSRMGLSPWFFKLDDAYKRASVILHEASHVLYNHFIRFERLPANPHTHNLAGDFEINTGLVRVNKINLEEGVLPDKDPYSYPPHKTLEQYIHYLNNDPNYQPPPPPQGGGGEKSQEGEGTPPPPGGGGNPGHTEGGHTCDSATSERSGAADAAGVERASAAEQSIAKRNTAVRTAEAARKARAAGDGTMAEFLDFANTMMQPPKVDWRSIFRKTVASTVDAIVKGKSDYSYRRVSRRMAGSDFIFPGMVTYFPKVAFGVDTSGSMGKEDHRLGVTEIEGIIRAANRSKGAMTVFSVDTTVQNIKPVSDVRKLNLQGGGGTAMEVGVDYVNQMPKRDRADIFVLATDGYTNWNAFEESLKQSHKNFATVVLVTQEGGFKGVTEGCKRLAHFIDISDDYSEV